MKFFKIILFVTCCFLFNGQILSSEIPDSNLAKKNTIPLQYIGLCGDGFYIEGGKLGQLINPNQKFLDLCMPLDRIFIDGQALEEITKNNPYPLKESSILNYNEHQVYLALLLIIDYYKKSQPGKKMLIQIHRHSSSFPFMDIFTEILTSYYKKNEGSTDYISRKNWISRAGWPADPKNHGFPAFTFSNGFYLEFLNGYEDNTLLPTPEFSYVFSLSWMGGLKPFDLPGTLTLPSYFIPFDHSTRYFFA